MLQLVLGLPEGHGTSSLGHGPSASPSSSTSSSSPRALAPENTRILRGDWLEVHIGKDIFSVESYGARGATCLDSDVAEHTHHHLRHPLQVTAGPTTPRPSRRRLMSACTAAARSDFKLTRYTSRAP